jgi:hypothetical protein
MSPAPLSLQRLPGRFAVCRLSAAEKLPGWAALAAAAPQEPALLSVTRTDRELSIVAPEEAVPAAAPRVERGWVALRVVGTLDFSMVGVLASLTGALAAAGICVMAISTYETDYLLLRGDDAARAVEALSPIADVSRL